MALHKDFPKSPYEILDPKIRWFPADEDLRKQGYGKLLPPLVHKLRLKVKKWRESHYEGASFTSKALLTWWFQTKHYNQGVETNPFQYYFAQREAIETVIWLYEVAQAKDKYDLIRYDSSGAVSSGQFPEDWLRMVIKMATGTGKTKVMSLLIAWSWFHKIYEKNSTLSGNFLIITPNIIVLDRIRSDFEGLKIFFQDPVLPENGFEGQNWKNDFQLVLHLQDNIGLVKKTGNIFLTNIHRIYTSKEQYPSPEDENTIDYFLGKKPVLKTTDSKVNLGEIVRNIDELMILNDEAHHIHDERLAWFQAIEDIHNKMKIKGGSLSLQIDVTATPKHNNGGIFVQTVSDYPLVEAIAQNVVKHPVLPDQASRAKLQEYQTIKFTEKYKDYIHLGFLEWKKTYERLKNTKKSILFVMTDDTRNCDDVNEYLQKTYPELKNAVLTIHTKNNGELFEKATGKKEKELSDLRKAANEIDTWKSPYKAIVSVLVLKEGWDVKNVTTIVGLRAYSAKSNILPEQTLGRGLRRMYGEQEDLTELVSVVGTPAFMNFVESIKHEGVELEKAQMGEGTEAKAPLLIEVDRENTKKDIQKLDIEIPVLSPRIYREYKNLSKLNISQFSHKKIKIKQFSDEEQKEIVFRDIGSGDVTHKTLFDSDFIPSYSSVIGYFAESIRRELRLFGSHDILYGKVKEFIIHHLFTKKIELEDLNILRNLSEQEVTKTIIENFKKEINNLTVVDKGEAEIKDYIKVSQARPFVIKEQGFIVPKKSVFNKIVGDSHFELEFSGFIETCEDIVSYAKNYFSVHFKIDYQNANGEIKDYYPDFLIKVSEKEVCIVETKGREDLDDIEKIQRLYQWCEDANLSQKKIKFTALYVKQEEYEKYKPSNFSQLKNLFEKK